MNRLAFFLLLLVVLLVGFWSVGQAMAQVFTPGFSPHVVSGLSGREVLGGDLLERIAEPSPVTKILDSADRMIQSGYEQLGVESVKKSAVGIELPGLEAVGSACNKNC